MLVFLHISTSDPDVHQMTPFTLDIKLERSEDQLHYFSGSLPAEATVGMEINICEPGDTLGEIVSISDSGFVVRDPLKK